MIGQKKGMVHRKRAWRSTMLKGPRGNTNKVSVIQGHLIRLPIENYAIMLNSICAIFGQNFTMIFNQIMNLYYLDS